ncbi:MAG TPA: hypothetical protein PKK12_08830, partial [Candidatus Aminicenantes bacterium]|nr:hypothetical protein [Candidatus Aminicenantes bacterium]
TVQGQRRTADGVAVVQCGQELFHDHLGSVSPPRPGGAENGIIPSSPPARQAPFRRAARRPPCCRPGNLGGDERGLRPVQLDRKRLLA